MSVGHEISLSLTYDSPKDLWTAKIRYSERRNGLRHGGVVGTQMTSAHNESHAAFLKRVRRRAKRDMDLFWS